MHQQEMKENFEISRMTNLLEKLKEEIQRFPDDIPASENNAISTNYFTTITQQSFRPEHSSSLQSLVTSHQSQNKSLKLDLENYERKLNELSRNIIDIEQQSKRLNEYCLQLEQNSSPRLPAFTSGPKSFPNFNVSNSASNLEAMVMEKESSYKKLKQQNISLQQVNQGLEKHCKELQDTNNKQKIKLEDLNKKLNSTEHVHFSPQQQPHINEFRQRLDQEITEVKRRLDSDVAQTQCDIDAAQRRQQEAENRLSDLERQVDLASKEATATDAQIDELKTALVVATRSPNQSQSLRSQETINKLKQELHQREEECKLKKHQLIEARHINQTLQQQSGRHHQTIVPPGGGRTSIERRNGNVVITNEGVTITETSIDEVD